LDSAPAIAAVRRRLREAVPGPGPDRHLAPEIEATVALLADGSLVTAAETVTGPLH
jgi:histidine ammonia-lyase